LNNEFKSLNMSNRGSSSSKRTGTLRDFLACKSSNTTPASNPPPPKKSKDDDNDSVTGTLENAAVIDDDDFVFCSKL
jgi:hypothetical protein